MSFSFTDIASTTSITGWFHLLAYLEGRSNFRKSTQEVRLGRQNVSQLLSQMPDMSASKRSSTNSLKKGLANVRKVTNSAKCQSYNRLGSRSVW